MKQSVLPEKGCRSTFNGGWLVVCTCIVSRMLRCHLRWVNAGARVLVAAGERGAWGRSRQWSFSSCRSLLRFVFATRIKSWGLSLAGDVSFLSVRAFRVFPPSISGDFVIIQILYHSDPLSRTNNKDSEADQYSKTLDQITLARVGLRGRAFLTLTATPWTESAPCSQNSLRPKNS